MTKAKDTLRAILLVFFLASIPVQTHAIDGSLGAKSVGIAKVTLHVAPQAMAQFSAARPGTLQTAKLERALCLNYNSSKGSHTRVLVASSLPNNTLTDSLTLLYQGDLSEEQCSKEWSKTLVSLRPHTVGRKNSAIRLLFEPAS